MIDGNTQKDRIRNEMNVLLLIISNLPSFVGAELEYVKIIRIRILMMKDGLMLNKVNLWLEKLISVILKSLKSCENVMNVTFLYFK